MCLLCKSKTTFSPAESWVLCTVAIGEITQTAQLRRQRGVRGLQLSGVGSPGVLASPSSRAPPWILPHYLCCSNLDFNPHPPRPSRASPGPNPILSELSTPAECRHGSSFLVSPSYPPVLFPTDSSPPSSAWRRQPRYEGPIATPPSS